MIAPLCPGPYGNANKGWKNYALFAPLHTNRWSKLYFSPLCNTLLFVHISSFFDYEAHICMCFGRIWIYQIISFLFISVNSLFEGTMPLRPGSESSHSYFAFSLRLPKVLPMIDEMTSTSFCTLLVINARHYLTHLILVTIFFFTENRAMTYVACWNFIGLPNWSVDSILWLKFNPLSTHLSFLLSKHDQIVKCELGNSAQMASRTIFLPPT